MRIKETIHSLNWEKIIKCIGFVVFTAICLRVFCNVTYLFRNTGYDRSHIVGIENEKVDMVYIGGSAAFMYWQPLKAWNDCGFTSYLYATNTIQAEQIKAYIEEARKSQNPELFVIGIRAFQYYSTEQVEMGIRNGADSMDLTSAARYKMLYEYFKHRDITEDTDIVSYVLDIAKYHTNTENLGSSAAWGFRDNKGISPNKGYEWGTAYAYLEKPTDFLTETRAELLKDNKEILVDLLTYCQQEDLNVLFVVCPYRISKREQEIYNAVGDIIEGYGFRYLNANEYYDEIGIDFSQDFYDGNHVNMFGASKYTEFLENYILEHYDMPDHRKDELYASWQEDYQRFLQEEAKYADITTNLRLSVEQGIEIAEQMSRAEILSEWANLAEDDRFTLFMAANGKIEWPQNMADQNTLNHWGFVQENSNEIRVVNDANIVYSNEIDRALSVEGKAGIGNYIPYCISIEDDICSIIVNGEEWFLSQPGINVVVFDNNYRRVVDVAAIRCGEEGRMKIYRNS